MVSLELHLDWHHASVAITSACCARARATLRPEFVSRTNNGARVTPNRWEPRSRMRPPKTLRAGRMQKIRTRRVGDALRLGIRNLRAYVQRFNMKKSKVNALPKKATRYMKKDG